MRRAGFFMIVFFLSGTRSWAGEPVLSASDYIAMWKDEAIFQMAENKIPASITLAQGMLESGNGNSRLARKANNHFGIKCHNDWDGPKIYEDDDAKNECFRKYSDARQSYEDHSQFLKRSRYQKLFDLRPDDYKAWAKGLKECGYATNPKYPDLLIKIIKENNLEQYDEIGMQYLKKGKLPDRPGGKESRSEVKEREQAAKENRKDRKKETPAETREITLHVGREVFLSQNRVKYVEAKEGETPGDIANEFDMASWQILRYNDLDKSAVLGESQVIFLQPKRSKGTQESYVVREGDNAWSISQEFGIKLNKLRKLNSLPAGQEPAVGRVLKLK